MLTWPAKDVDARLPYSWDIDLQEGDSVSAHTVTLISGSITVVSSSESNGIITALIEGGTAGETAVIEIEATGTDGSPANIYTQSFVLQILDENARLPVTPDQLRSELRDVTDPDLELRDLIAAATELVEEQTGQILIARQMTWAFDAWPVEGAGLGDWDGVRQGSIRSFCQSAIELPYSPLISVESITTYASDNEGTVLDASAYYVDTIKKPGRIALNQGASWPLPGRAINGIIISYTAGYSTAAEIPAHLRRAVMQIAAHWYENRELMDFDGGKQLPMQAQRIIESARVRRL